MDQKRLLLAIAISISILVGFQLLMPHSKPVPPAPIAAAPATPAAVAAAAAADTTQAVPREVPRLSIKAPRVSGSISLLGARIDDVVLADYRETIAANSPQVHILEPRSEPQPSVRL